MATDDKFKHFDELKEHLKGCRGVKHENEGKNLFDHMRENVFTHLVTHCPQDALDKLEEVSYCYKKQDKIDMSKFLKMDAINNYAKPSDAAHKESTEGQINSAITMFSVPKAEKVEGEEGDVPPPE